MKYTIGTKVILKSKHNSKCELEDSLIYKLITKKNQKFAFIVGFYSIRSYSDNIDNINCYVISDDLLNPSGDFFEESDVEPYITQERKLKLKKIYEKLKTN